MLARPPRPPSDPELFSSNTLFGEPGIYPQGSPMEPAGGGPMPNSELRDEITRLVHGHARRLVDATRLVDAAPDETIRSALVALIGTVAQDVADAFPAGTTAQRLEWGVPSSPGRIVGPAGDDPTARVVNERYRAEHFALFAGSLAHDLLWTPETAGHAAEALLHALVAMVHIQTIARLPRIARLGTELARRQNSLAITLLNSRHPGSHRISLVAPDGPGTIPGGAPTMQTPDFWSIPFAPDRVTDAPPLLAKVLDQLVPRSVARPEPLRFDNHLAAWIDANRTDAWLPIADHARVAVALGLVDVADLASAAGVDAAHVRSELAR